MGLLSKVVKKVKGAVKGIARGIKKVAKAVAYAVPGGKQGWDFSSKVGGEVMKGVGKVVSKIGPVGMMAISAVLAVTGIGAPLAAALQGMWGAFGAGAAAMAGSANILVSTLGTIGSSVFAAGNFIGGTLGALGNAFTQGASNVMAGNFQGAVSSFATNMGSALSGEAGMAAVNQGITSSAASSLAKTTEITGTAGVESIATEQGLAATATGANGLPVEALDFSGDLAVNTSSIVTEEGIKTATSQVATDATFKDIVAQQAASPYSMSLQDQVAQGMSTEYTQQAMNDNFKDAKEAYDKGKKFLGTSDSNVGYQTAQPELLDVPKLNATPVGSLGKNRQGVGSNAFSLLSGVRGLEQSVRGTQAQMLA